MKLKLLLLLALLIVPLTAPAYYVYHPCCRSGSWWAEIDYMLVWRKKRFYPPLATTNTILLPVPQRPVLGAPGTNILFGDKFYGGKPKSGFRIDIGAWCSSCWAWGVGYLGVVNEEINFSITGNESGSPIIGRPFFNPNTGLEDAELISFPGRAKNGKIDIDAPNRLWDFNTYARYRFWKTPCYKFDLLVGFDANQIKDVLEINASKIDIGPDDPNHTLHLVNDEFECKNEFWGGLIGAVTEWRGKKWGALVSAKVGLGSMRKKVEIEGSTTLTNALGTTVVPVGLLAQTSNIGETKHSKFEWVPQFNANLQWRACGHLWLEIGYLAMYWPCVVLAGDQVDLNVNREQPPFFPGRGIPLPTAHQQTTHFWIQGLTAGIYVFY